MPFGIQHTQSGSQTTNLSEESQRSKPIQNGHWLFLKG